jgi:hypothetical protein
MAAPSERASKGRNRRVSVPFLQADEAGFPAWLRPEDHPGGRWRRVAGSIVVPFPDAPFGIISVSGAPTRLPQLQSAIPAPERYGRPPLVEREPERVEFAARGRDLCNLSDRKIGQLVDRIGSPEAARAQARRDIRAGRARLHDDGVLPWAVYKAGCVQPEWWASEQFADAIQQWRREAAIVPSQLPEAPSINVADVAERMMVPEGFAEALARRVRLPYYAKQLREIERNPWRFSSL